MPRISFEKQPELAKASHQKFKDNERQKTLYQHLFGQSPLQLEQELKAVDTETACCEKDKRNYGKAMQDAASVATVVPKKDFSSCLFYSHTLRTWNFDYPPDQLGLYLITLTGFGKVSKAFWESWNIKKSMEILKQGKDSVEVGKFDFHMHSSGVPDEADLVRAMAYRGFMVGKAITIAGFLIIAYTGFVQLKNKNRFDK